MKKHFLLFTCLALVVIISWWIAPHHEVMTLLIYQSGWWGPLVAVLLYGVLSLTPVPSDPLTIAVTLLYGPLLGFLISWMGNNVAAIIEYIFAKQIEGTFHFDYRRLPLPLQKIPVDSILFLIGIRFVPAVGGKTVAILAGMYQIPWSRFIWTTAVANALGSLIWVLGGVGIFSLFS